MMKAEGKSTTLFPEAKHVARGKGGNGRKRLQERNGIRSKRLGERLTLLSNEEDEFVKP